MKNKSQNTIAFFSDILSKYSSQGLKHAFFTSKVPFVKNPLEMLSDFSLPCEKISQFFLVEKSRLVIPQQFHSNIVKIIDNKNYQNSFQADGFVSREKNIALGVLTADCGPILFFDPQNEVIAATHAGWRGAFSDIIENTVKSMERQGAKRSSIQAILGPSLGVKNYVIDAPFREIFVKSNPDFENFFIKTENKDRYFFNFQEFILFKCKKSQIKADSLNLCTYKNQDSFFSYRRMKEQQGNELRRQISVILLKNI